MLALRARRYLTGVPCSVPPVVVKRGAVVEQGTHKQLMEKHEAYYNLVQMQQVRSSGRGWAARVGGSMHSSQHMVCSGRWRRRQGTVSSDDERTL